MGNAARAIIINDGKILVMRRNKQGSDYYTLVGGLVDDAESIEQGLIREVKEETGMQLTAASLVFTEKHHAPYNDQFIYLCHAASYDSVGLSADSEEAIMNKQGVNVHEPMWVSLKLFERLPFLTGALQAAIVKSLKKDFPREPVAL